MEVDGRSVTLGAGKGIWIPAGVAHQMKNDSGGEVHFLVISQPPSHGDRVAAPETPSAGSGLIFQYMPLFCDVALAVPLDMAFTYAIPPGMEPVVGGRVLVPFRQQRMSGIVVELHDRAPQVKTKNVIEVLDPSPVLDEQLLRLGRWIADYYLAPLGEVFRTMLPLSAEFKRTITYRITDQGQMALHLAATAGSPGRSQRSADEQLLEFRVLDYLAERGGSAGD